MTSYRFARIQTGFSSALEELPTSVDLPAAGIASVLGDVEAFHRVAFEDLPKEVIQQLRYDGTRGEGRSLDDARAVFDHNVPADAHGSTEGVAAIANDPTIDWGHKTPFVHGGSNDASNGVYLPETLNSHIGDRPMTPAEVHQAEAYTHQVALDATPGVSGDLGHVAVHTAETSLYGGAIGGGMAVAHRLAQIKGFRDAGRHDLAMDAEDELGSDAARGMVNGVVRGTSVAVTQAILGANPLTAGIGLVAPQYLQASLRKGPAQRGGVPTKDPEGGQQGSPGRGSGLRRSHGLAGACRYLHCERLRQGQPAGRQPPVAGLSLPAPSPGLASSQPVESQISRWNDKQAEDSIALLCSPPLISLRTTC